MFGHEPGFTALNVSDHHPLRFPFPQRLDLRHSFIGIILAEQIGLVYFPTYGVVLTFVIMVVALAVRPRGIMGKAA